VEVSSTIARDRSKVSINIIQNVSCPDDGYRALAASVVLQARRDFRTGSRATKKETREWLLSDKCVNWLGFMNLTIDSSQIEKWIFRETIEYEEV
jgi:hypothetical protein